MTLPLLSCFRLSRMQVNVNSDLYIVSCLCLPTPSTRDFGHKQGYKPIFTQTGCAMCLICIFFCKNDGLDGSVHGLWTNLDKSQRGQFNLKQIRHCLIDDVQLLLLSVFPENHAISIWVKLSERIRIFIAPASFPTWLIAAMCHDASAANMTNMTQSCFKGLWRSDLFSDIRFTPVWVLISDLQPAFQHQQIKCFLASFKLEAFVPPPHCKLSFLPCIDTCNNAVGPRDSKLVWRNFLGGHLAENSKKCWNLRSSWFRSTRVWLLFSKSESAN